MGKFVMSKAKFKITHKSGTTVVDVTRDYPAGTYPTAQRVWEVVSDFAGLKKIFPSLVRLYVTYPAATSTAIGTVRDMTFAIPDTTNPLAFGVEQLVELNHESRRLTYRSVLGLPTKSYSSVMEVKGDNSCTLHWTSTYIDDGGGAAFADSLAHLLTGGADQIAVALNLS
jgi:hypothetical protein